MSQAVNAALSALGALGVKMDVTAINIANVNTDGIKRAGRSLKIHIHPGSQYP